MKLAWAMPFVLLLGACGPTAVVGDADGGGNAADPDAATIPTGGECAQTENDLEGCACAPIASSRSCYLDEAVQVRGVGACHDGSQVCTAADDTSPVWGPCLGAQLPTDDVGVDGQDQDCDGDDGDQSCTPENCTDGVDNDCDGLSDCGDIDCDPEAVCHPCAGTSENCTNGIDDDCDGLTDCVDPTCLISIACLGACFHPEDCSDGVDNNCDGLIDCLDSACGPTPACGCSCTPGTQRYCDTPTACAWGQQTCMPDNTWGTCTEVGTPPGGCPGGGYYSTDCCLSLPDACCQDFADTDGDGNTWESVGECSGITTC